MINSKASPEENLTHHLKEIIAEIPFGVVATVEEITEALEEYSPSADETLWALKEIDDVTIPTWRVIRQNGALIAPYGVGEWENQKEVLESEGINFNDDTTVDVEKHFWSACEYIKN